MTHPEGGGIAGNGEFKFLPFDQFIKQSPDVRDLLTRNDWMTKTLLKQGISLEDLCQEPTPLLATILKNAHKYSALMKLRNYPFNKVKHLDGDALKAELEKAQITDDDLHHLTV